MRKNVFGRQFKRDTNERKALFKGLISSLVLHERIKTTEEKAKSIKALADKIITIAKKGAEKARYLLQGELPKETIDKVILKIAPRFDKRHGGYTRIVKIGRRFSDNASMVVMEWVENEVKSRKSEVKSMDEKNAITETQSREARSGSARNKAETQERKRVKMKR